MTKGEIPDRKGTDDWRTPPWLMAVFDGWYDPCPLKGADGLSLDWGEKTYVNPPYSDPMPWVDKAIKESRKNKLVVMLVKLDPSTKWYHKLQAAGGHFVTFNERLKFWGDKNDGAYFPSVLVILEKSQQAGLE